MVHTWPLATDPAHLSRNDNSDAVLNEWIVSWIAHQLPRDPLNLFHANIFHPEQYTLAYSDPLIVPALLGLPIRALGASPVLTFNILLLLGFFLTALAMYGVVVAWTRDHLAGILAGSLLAFNAHTMTRLPHLQAIHAEGVPLALWALDRLITGSRTRDGLWLALCGVSLALTSGYTAIITAFGLLGCVIARFPEWRGHRAIGFVSRIALSAAIALALVVPVLWPYQVVRAEQGLVRSLENVTQYSALPWNYLVTTARWHYDVWSHHWYETLSFEALFPGAVALALSVVACVRARSALTRARVLMIVTMGAIGFVMSLGTNTPVYGWVYAILPPLQGLRAAARFGYLVMLAVAVLAGFGLAALRERWFHTRWMTPVAVVLIAVANLEALHTKIPYERFEGIPPIYDALAEDQVSGVLVEVPFYDRRNFHLNAPYMLASTRHWRPLLNGYSGFRPQSYVDLAETMEQFPRAHVLRALRRRNVRYIMVHGRDFRTPFRARQIIHELGLHPDVGLVTSDDDGRRLYRLLEPFPGQAP